MQPASRATMAAGSPVAPAPITTISHSRSQLAGGPEFFAAAGIRFTMVFCPLVFSNACPSGHQTYVRLGEF